MDVLQIPFNHYIGLKYSTDPEYLMILENKKEYQNHLGTVHASALFALAEASGGFFLLNEFQQSDKVIPVVRSVVTKFKKPASGAIYSAASLLETSPEIILEELNTKQRALVKVRVQLFDTVKTNVMQADFEWFLMIMN